MKIAPVVGHNAKARGAVRADGVAEYEWNCELAEMIRQLDPENVKIFHRTPGPGQVRRVYAETDAWGADVTLELHFNSVSDPSATGTETLSSGSRGSLKLARAVQAGMLKALGLRNRGIKVRNKVQRGRGYTSLIAGRAPAVILEPFFGSNPTDAKTADEKKEALARAIYEAARAAAG